MSNTPTRFCAKGETSSGGEDFVHYTTKRGAIAYWVDQHGATYGSDFLTASGVSLNALRTTVENLILSGLPPAVDAGTF